MKNADGQIVANYNADANCKKAINELIGLAKGLLADKILQTTEVDFLIKWLEANSHISDIWPANVLFDRVDRALEDGFVDDEERQELFDILQKISGLEQLKENRSSGLPLDDPQPKIKFSEHLFCVTGKFAYGPRAEVEKLIIERGGNLASNVTKNLDYLVIGVFSSRDWISSSHGRKIEKAVEYRDSGTGLKIISEDHFINSVFAS